YKGSLRQHKARHMAGLLSIAERRGLKRSPGPACVGWMSFFTSTMALLGGSPPGGSPPGGSPPGGSPPGGSPPGGSPPGGSPPGGSPPGGSPPGGSMKRDPPYVSVSLQLRTQPSRNSRPAPTHNRCNAP